MALDHSNSPSIAPPVPDVSLHDVALPDVSLPRLSLPPPSDSTLGQLSRYTVVGGIAFACDYATLFVLTAFAGLHYLVSGALAFLAGLLVNYALSVRFVFRQRRVRDARLEFAIFAAIGLAGLGINEGMLYLLTGVAGVHYMVSKLGATAVSYLWNFFARKYSLFTA